MREVHGDSGNVAEYLLAEVLNAQPEPARDLLLRTSIVDVMRPGLVEELAGHQARRALVFLVRGNAFIEESTETPGSYTYHPLFRELLRAQLSYETPELVPELHRKQRSGWRPTVSWRTPCVTLSRRERGKRQPGMSLTTWPSLRFSWNGRRVGSATCSRVYLPMRSGSARRWFALRWPWLTWTWTVARVMSTKHDRLLDRPGAARRTAVDLAFSVLLLAHARGLREGAHGCRCGDRRRAAYPRPTSRSARCCTPNWPPWCCRERAKHC